MQDSKTNRRKKENKGQVLEVKVRKTFKQKGNQELLTCSFIVIHIYSLQLKIRVSVICSSWVNTMFIRDDFPELKKIGWVG